MAISWSYVRPIFTFVKKKKMSYPLFCFPSNFGSTWLTIGYQRLPEITRGYQQAFKMIRAGSCTSDVVACLENNKLDKSFIIKSILAQFLVINKCSVTQDECYCYSIIVFISVDTEKNSLVHWMSKSVIIGIYHSCNLTEIINIRHFFNILFSFQHLTYMIFLGSF